MPCTLANGTLARLVQARGMTSALALELVFLECLSLEASRHAVRKPRLDPESGDALWGDGLEGGRHLAQSSPSQERLSDISPTRNLDNNV